MRGIYININKNNIQNYMKDIQQTYNDEYKNWRIIFLTETIDFFKEELEKKELNDISFNTLVSTLEDFYFSLSPFLSKYGKDEFKEIERPKNAIAEKEYKNKVARFLQKILQPKIEGFLQDKNKGLITEEEFRAKLGGIFEELMIHENKFPLVLKIDVGEGFDKDFREKIQNMILKASDPKVEKVVLSKGDYSLMLENIEKIGGMYSPKEAEQIDEFDKFLKSEQISLSFYEGKEDYVWDNERFWSWDAVKKANSELDDFVREIKSLNLTPFEAVLYIHNYCASFEYNYMDFYQDGRKKQLVTPREVINVFETGQIVCVGYAQMFKAIVEKLGMPGLKTNLFSARMVSRVNKQIGGHALNTVEIDDPKYNIHGTYIEDSCWDSKRGDDKKSTFAFCLNIQKCYQNIKGRIFAPISISLQEFTTQIDINKDDRFLKKGKMEERLENWLSEKTTRLIEKIKNLKKISKGYVKVARKISSILSCAKLYLSLRYLKRIRGLVYQDAKQQEKVFFNKQFPGEMISLDTYREGLTSLYSKIKIKEKGGKLTRNEKIEIASIVDQRLDDSAKLAQKMFSGSSSCFLVKEVKGKFDEIPLNEEDNEGIKRKKAEEKQERNKKTDHRKL